MVRLVLKVTCLNRQTVLLTLESDLLILSMKNLITKLFQGARVREGIH